MGYFYAFWAVLGIIITAWVIFEAKPVTFPWWIVALLFGSWALRDTFKALDYFITIEQAYAAGKWTRQLFGPKEHAEF